MDISNVTYEQKMSAAVAYLSKNIEFAPPELHESINKLNRVNNDGMEIVRKIQEMQNQMKQLENSLSEHIGAAKILFEIIGERIPKDKIDEYASKFDVKQFQAEIKSNQNQIDIAGATAKQMEQMNAKG